MKALARLLLALLPLLVAGGAARAQDSAGTAYAVGGIEVDVVGPNSEAARLAGYRIAQRKAWPQLYARLTGQPATAAPHLSDGQLDNIVSGIESQGERFSTTRYIARLGVVFDRTRTSEYFGGGSGSLQSPPMLLLPVFTDGGVRTLYQARTPWRAAWQRFRENVTPIDYVLATGSAGDNLVLTAWQVARPDRPIWRDILNRFDTVDVLSAEVRLVRSYPGGPIRALFIARHGPDATELGRFVLSANDESGIDAMLDAGVRGIDDIYAVALRDGRLQSEADLSTELTPILASAPLIGSAADGEGPSDAGASLEVALATPDAATASGIEAQLRGTPGVTGVTVTSLSLGGTTRMLIGYSGTAEALAYALDGRGLRLVRENGEAVLRRRREGDAPIAPPAAPAPALPAAVVSPTPAPRPASVAGAPPKPGAAPGPPRALVPASRAAAAAARPAPAKPTRPANGPIDLLPTPQQ